MTRPYTNVVRTISETPWAVLPGMLLIVRHVVAEHQARQLPDEDELAARFEAERAQAAEARARADGLSGAGIAVLPLYGVMTPRADLMTEMSGGTSMEAFRGWVRTAAADKSIGAIVLDVDSPGGMVGGVPEAAAELRAAREKKPVLAVVNTLAASAAYWLAAQARELAVAPSAELGSIGVFTAHQDLSGMAEDKGVKMTLISAGKYKTEGNPFEPLSPEAEAAIQAKVDAYYEMFAAEVALGRGTTTERVKGPAYGEGRLMLAGPAVKSKAADYVATLEETVVRAAGRIRSGGSRAQSFAFAGGDRLLEAVARGFDLPTSVLHAFSTPSAGGSPNASGSWTVTVGSDELDPAYTAIATADRPARPTPDLKETEMDEPQETTEPQTAVAVAEPRQVDPARDELFKAVHDLTEAVHASNEGRGDRESVDRLTDEVMDLRKRLDESQARTGYQPEDQVAERFPDGDAIARTWEMPVKRASVTLHRPEEDVADFRTKADNLILLSAMMKKDPRELKYYGEEYLPALAAIDTQTTAEGKEFVPTILSADLIPRVELALRVVGLFRAIDMPSNPFEIPGFAVTRVRGGKAVENTADTGQTPFKKVTPGTRKIQLNASKFAAEVLVSKEEEEDSLIPILAFLTDEITSQLSFDMEDSVVNGDAQGAHMDSDVTATDDPRRIWDGFRNLVPAAAKTDGSAAIVDSVKLRAQRKKMGKYGVDSSQLVHVLSIAGYVNLLSDVNTLTLEKYGPQAVILNGELARVDGIPIVVSQFVRDDLNATGVYDGTTTTKTIAITVNTNCWLVGNRRALTVQTLRELYAEYDQDAIAVSMRKAFVPAYPVATEPIVALTYNLNN